MRIGIVTDSTANKPPEFYEEYNDLVMVPAIVNFGTESFVDWIEMPPVLFYKTMAASVEKGIYPTTSQPSPGDFIQAYEKLAAAGVDHILSIHVSNELSGTLASAHMAAKSFKGIPVTVFDSRQTSGVLGTLVKMLAEARDNGADLAELSRLAEYGRDWGLWLFRLETMEYMNRGGRAGKAGTPAAQPSNLMPLLAIKDGVVAPAAAPGPIDESISGMIKIIKDRITARPDGHPVRLIIGYTSDIQILDRLRAAITAVDLQYDYLETIAAGSAVGVHSGPGCFMMGVL